jgi:arginine exporter protein ArgO
MKRDTFTGIFTLLAFLLAGAAAIVSQTHRVLGQVILWGGAVLLIAVALAFPRRPGDSLAEEQQSAVTARPPRLWPALVAIWLALAFLTMAIGAVFRYPQHFTPTTAILIFIAGAALAIPPLLFALTRLSAVAQHRAQAIVNASRGMDG